MTLTQLFQELKNLGVARVRFEPGVFHTDPQVELPDKITSALMAFIIQQTRERLAPDDDDVLRDLEGVVIIDVPENRIHFAVWGEVDTGFELVNVSDAWDLTPGDKVTTCWFACLKMFCLPWLREIFGG